MNKQEAIKRHKERLANLTEERAVNLMEHASNKTPLLPIESFNETYVDAEGRC